MRIKSEYSWIGNQSSVVHEHMGRFVFSDVIGMLLRVFKSVELTDKTKVKQKGQKE